MSIIDSRKAGVILVAAVLCMGMALVPTVEAQQIRYLTAQPLADQISVNASAARTGGTKPLPLITWGGDVSTIYTQTGEFFQQAGLSFNLAAENDFRKQVEACISGQSPYIRGTKGMINVAADALKQKGLELVPIYQLTWSVGGDAMVVRSHIRRPSDLKGKTIALQLYGPHMDYVANILANAKVPLSSVTFKWLKELTLPTYETSSVVDPVSAFQADPSLDAVMCIIPDALMLTSGGATGTGAEGSVKGAKVLLSTKTASRVIADVYAVRKDYLDANRAEVQKFVHVLMVGQEALQELVQNKSAQQAKYRQLLSSSADLLLGASQATADVEALLGDCEFVGYDGNVQFFTGRGTTRSLQTLTGEVQNAFVSMGLMRGKVAISSANWDYTALARGLRNATPAQAATAPRPKPVKPKFDQQKVTRKVEEQISVEPTTWAEEGTLFVVEINFAPNQKTFDAAQYQDDFAEALRIAETYGGSLIVVEGHSDPLGILKARQDGKHQAEIAQMEQTAKTLSLQRADAVRDSFLSFCKNRKVGIDDSQFVPVGLGIASPKFSPPRTKEEWAANRRVVFRIKQVEAELDEFVPLN